MDDNNQQRKGITIYEMVKEGAQSLLGWVIEEGIDVNSTDEDGESLLFIASEHLRCNMIKFLLTKGATPLNDEQLKLLSPYQQNIYESIESQWRGEKDKSHLYIALKASDFGRAESLIREGAAPLTEKE